MPENFEPIIQQIINIGMRSKVDQLQVRRWLDGMAAGETFVFMPDKKWDYYDMCLALIPFLMELGQCFSGQPEHSISEVFMWLMLAAVLFYAVECYPEVGRVDISSAGLRRHDTLYRSTLIPWTDMKGATMGHYRKYFYLFYKNHETNTHNSLNLTRLRKHCLPDTFYLLIYLKANNL